MPSKILNKVENLILEIQKSYRLRVEVIIFNNKNEILLTTIPPYGRLTDPYHGFPGGGIEDNEDPITAIKREALEEVGYEIDNIKQIKIKPFILKWNDDMRTLKNTNHYGSNTQYYTANVVKENKKYYNSEGDALEYQFVSISKAIELLQNDISKMTPEESKILRFRLNVLKQLKY